MATEKAEFQLTLDQRPFEASMAKARRSTVGLTEATNKAGAAVGAAATSVSGLNTALGNATSTTNNMIGAAGNLATTFAAAGPLGLGIAAVTTAVGLLVGAWEKAEKVSRDAAREQEQAIDRLVDKVKQGVEQNKGKIVSLLGIDETRLAFAQLRQEQRAAAEQLETLRAQLRPGLVQARLNKEIEQAENRWFDVSARVAEAEAALEEYNRTADIVARAEARRGGSAAPRVARPGRGGARAAGPDFSGADAHVDEFHAEQARLAEIELAVARDKNQALLDEGEKMREREIQLEEWRKERMVKLIKDEAAFREEMDRRRLERARAVAEYSIAIAQQVADVTVEAARIILSGEENAHLKILALVAERAGGFILGEGLKLGSMGVANLLTPGMQGWGAAQLAGGVALATIGASMKVGGLAAMEAASGTFGSLGGLVSVEPDDGGGGASSSRTAGRGIDNPNSGSGGGLVVNISYGVGGPNKEDAERAVMDAFREAQRKGF